MLIKPIVLWRSRCRRCPRFLNSLLSVLYAIRTWNKHAHMVPCLDATRTTEFSYHTCGQYNSLKPTEHHRTGCLISRKKAYLMAMVIFEPLGGGNLVPKVLSLPRESTLVMAGHVSIHANYRRTEGGSSTNFNFNFNFPAPPFDHISGIC